MVMMAVMTMTSLAPDLTLARSSSRERLAFCRAVSLESALSHMMMKDQEIATLKTENRQLNEEVARLKGEVRNHRCVHLYEGVFLSTVSKVLEAKYG